MATTTLVKALRAELLARTSSEARFQSSASAAASIAFPLPGRRRGGSVLNQQIDKDAENQDARAMPQRVDEQGLVHSPII